MSDVQKFREMTGTNILVGQPARPATKKLRRQISKVIGDVDSIREAHMPDVTIVGSSEGVRRVLILVFDDAAAISRVMNAIDPELEQLSAGRDGFDVWAITSSNKLIDAIRDANCVIGWRD